MAIHATTPAVPNAACYCFNRQACLPVIFALSVSLLLLQVAYGWVVKSATDGTPKATATGQTATVLLGPGLYVATLNVVDNTGASAVYGPVQFRVTGSGPTGNAGGGLGPNAVMVAVIKSPPQIVIAEKDLQGGNKSINLDASGSTPSPGHLIDKYVWTVMTQQLGNMQLISNQTVKQANAAFVSLPVGSYIVSLVMFDTSGRNSSITQVGSLKGGIQAAWLAWLVHQVRHAATGTV